MRRVLVTGGAGFIGSHLVEHVLATTDWSVVVLDGLTYAGDVSRLTTQADYDPKRVEILWHDLRAPINDSVSRRIGDVDAVFAVASESHVDRSIADPVSFVQANVALASNLLHWAKDRPITHFVQVSTDEVYGPAEAGVSHKEWDPIIPSNPYAASKAAQEAIAVSYWRTFGVPVVITNTMNNFGERQHPEKFIPMTIARLMEGKSVPVHGRWWEPETRQHRETFWSPSSRVWMHARNHADALCWLVRNTEPAKYPEAHRPDRWNVAGDDEIDVETLVYDIAMILERRASVHRVDYHSSRPGHDLRYSLDGSKLAAAGWKAPVPFLESLERTVRWTVDHAGVWLAA